MASTKLVDPSTPCICNKCGFKTRAIPDKVHRNCSGESGIAPKTFDKRVSKTQRGKWEAE